MCIFLRNIQPQNILTHPSSIFKGYVEDLSQAIECFKYSSSKKELYRGLKGYKHTEDIGVLFWLSNERESYDDLISKLANSNIEISRHVSSLYLVDNKRLSFLYLTIKYANNKYSGHGVYFFYPSTGRNVNPLDKKNYGSALPIEYFNASVLPLRVEKSDGSTILILFTIEDFTPNDLRRLMGLSQELSKSWTGLIEISFPQYNSLQNESLVNEVKSGFSETFSNKVIVTSYTDHFTTLTQ